MDSQKNDENSEIGCIINNKICDYFNNDLQFFCEWDNCQKSFFDDMTLFLCHLRTHSGDIKINDKNDTIYCLWNNCNEEFSLSKINEFNLHLSYHGYHSKLMGIGAMVIKKISKQMNKHLQCFVDSNARTILPTLPESFVCGWKECFTEYTDAESFYRHVELHPFEDVHIPLMSKDELKVTKFAKCFWNDCNSAFNTRSHLRDHLRSHTQEKLIACPNCGSMFCSKLKFCDHILRQSLNHQLSDEQLQTVLLHVSIPDNKQQVTLTLIPQIGSNNESDQLEIDTFVANSSLADNSNEKIFSKAIGSFECKICSKKFATTSLLREHKKTHSSGFQCDSCTFSTSSFSALTHHKKYRHSKERPFSCQFCDSKFKSRSDLRKHIDTHSDDHPYKCMLCSFKCRCCHTLSRHQKKVHESYVTKYECHLCKQTFTRGNNMTRHLNKKHKMSLPPGKARFNYKRDNDGVYRIVE